MSWKITFFNPKVKEETLKFPDGILADLLHILDIIEEFGPDVGKPYTASMGRGLFEIRARGKEGIGRSLFCTVKGKESNYSEILYQENAKDSSEGDRNSP